ncbi:nucleosome assembly protein 1 1 isoform X6 [Biomphalaria glabrata]|nr:nucleosome assembly protein 1 1 isoform X6 [Biomphalaria glabrata]
MSEPENPSSDAVEDVEDEDHGEETGEVGDSQAIANQLMKNPGVLAALQDKLCSIVGSPSGYIQSLPKERKEILIAAREPTDEDCDWASEEEDDEDKDEDAKLAPDSQQGELKDKVTLEGTKEAGGDSEEKKARDPVGFTLEFYFEPNEYFTDTVLTKRYEMRYDPDSQDPLSYEGPEIIKCSGCTINWNKGKNVTVKQIKKKQKHKGRGLTRTVTKQVQADSFFNFFNPPAVRDGSESEMDEETEALLGADFEIGHFIRERIIPRAVLFFTGEAIETEDYEDDENDESPSPGEEEDYDEEADPDFNPEAQGKPNECKQQ